MKERSLLLVQPAEPHPCSYLEGQQSLSLYVDPKADLDAEMLTLLSLNGFRRSGRLVYRPNCPNCQACLSTRLRAFEFLPNKAQKRIVKRNLDLTLSVEVPNNSDEFYALFERYINERHSDGDMYPASREQFADFLTQDFGTTRYLVARQQQKIIACMVFDVLHDGLSSVYCFYDPAAEARSLGTLMIVRLTQLTYALGLPYNYLGYFVAGSPKMDYKRHFKPQEVWLDGRWQWLQN